MSTIDRFGAASFPILGYLSEDRDSPVVERVSAFTTSTMMAPRPTTRPKSGPRLGRAAEPRKTHPPRIRSGAAAIMLERGWGNPEVKADVTTTHAFAVVRQTMTKEEWLRCRGQPRLSDGTVPPVSLDAPTTLDAILDCI